MKKIIILLTLVSVTTCALAQNIEQTTVTDQKHSVATNSFWSNWFFQANAVGTSFWGSQESSAVKFNKLFKDYRTNLGFSVALGKWFTPGIGLRTKFNGLWGRTILSDSKSLNANKYWTLQEQALFNLSNLLMGYNEQRVWNVIPYVGGGIGRNMTYNRYAMGLSVGLLNTFRLSPKFALNLDINYGAYEKDFDGVDLEFDHGHTWKNKDRNLNLEIGLTYRLGKSTWSGTPDVEAMRNLAQSELDALNAQLADLQAENDRLNSQLSSQREPVPAPQPTTIIRSSVISVFFNLNQSVIASRKDLQDVADLVRVARQQDGARFLVTGYADSQTGSVERNRQLSEERAAAVVAELENLGVARDRIDVVAAGGVDTLNPQPYNRRATVEIK